MQQKLGFNPSKVSASEETDSNLEFVVGTLQLYFKTLTNLLNVLESFFKFFKNTLAVSKAILA